MLRSSEEETEILLGNKQLLGIFFVVAILLGIAFTGGYMVGRGSGEAAGLDGRNSGNGIVRNSNRDGRRNAFRCP